VLDAWHKRREDTVVESGEHKKQLAILSERRNRLEHVHIFEQSITRDTYERQKAIIDAEI